MAGLLGGALTGGREYVLKIVADVSDAVKGVDQVTTQTTTMKDKMVGIGKSIATGMAVGAVVAFGKSVVQAGMDADAGMDAVVSVFGEASNEVIKFSKTTAESMGMSAAEYQTMAARTGQALTGMGISQADAAKQTEVMAQRAADLAAIFGGDATEAMGAFDKAMMGQTRGLKKYNIVIEEADIKARAMAEGYVDASGEVTDAGKAIAAQELILEKTAKQAGAYAENSGDLGSQQEILKAKIDNLQQSLGTALLPVLEKLITLVQPFVDFIAKNAGWLVPVATGILAIVTAVKLWTVAQAALNLVLTANPIGLIVIAIAALVAALILAYQKVDWFRDAVDAMGRAIVAAFEWVKEVVVGVFNWIKENWPLLLAILTGPIGLAVLAITKHWDKIKEGFAAVFGWIKDAIWAFPGQVRNLLGDLGNIILAPFKWAFDQIMGALRGVGDFFWELPGKIRGWLGPLTDIITAPFRAAFDAIKWLWNRTIGGFGFTVPSWIPGIGGKEFRIPKLATGGVVTRPTIALLGEAGPEAVIPLNRAGVTTQQPTVNYTINVYALTANAEVGKRVYDALLEFERTTGRTLVAS